MTAADQFVEEGLFDAPTPVALPKETAGEVRRRRQLRAISLGQHPLSVALGMPLGLHRAARRDDDQVTPGTPRCGGCALRQTVAHHDYTYPKCRADSVPRSMTQPDGRTYTWNEYPRATNGPGTDVKRWWPACVDFQPIESATGPASGRGTVGRTA